MPKNTPEKHLKMAGKFVMFRVLGAHLKLRVLGNNHSLKWMYV